MRKTTTCHAEYLESTSPESVEFTIEYLGEKFTVFISSQNTSLYKSEEALVSTTFLPCLMKKMNCTISGAVSQTFKKGLRDIYKTTRGWGWAKCDGGWNDIEERNNEKIKGQRTGLFFSGGVDSFYTLLKHRYEISDLIYIVGFDKPLSLKTNGSMIIEKLRQAADEFGKNLIEIKTNLRDFSNKQLNPNFYPYDWSKAHGAALATIAHSLSGDFNKIFIATSFSNDDLYPNASHPDIDPKWSSDQVKLLHDGCEATRLEKIKLIAKNETALKTLRVCLKHIDGAYNCGKCEKCIRTLLGLRAVGVKDHAISFAAPLDIEKVRKQNLRKKYVRKYAAENLKALKANSNDQEIVKALQYAFKKVDKWELFRDFMREEKRRRKNQLQCLFSR